MSLMNSIKTNAPIKITCVVGTRPEAIKMAPVISALARDAAFETVVLASGQHADMLTQALDDFGLSADVNLNIMKNTQTLEHIASAVIEGVGKFLGKARQDMLLVHGDTATTLGAALAAFYRRTPIGHVEAGLRSRDLKSPFPEEANRVLTDKISSLFFAPTERAAGNLLAEGCDAARVFVTGNTVIDALFWILKTTSELGATPDFLRVIPRDAPLVLFTAHRRESWGEPLKNICGAILRVSEAHPEIRVLVPLHKNPVVRDIIRSELGGNDRVIFSEPLSYRDFVAAMNRSLFLLSDSGGVQEEASALKKPVLILREISERPEAISHGTGVLVGTNPDEIEKESLRLIEDEKYLASFAEKTSPFGDGQASGRICDIIKTYFADKDM
ncbi:UDP-N-acetyl glucosamine 2-epimerase [Synergistales bacterium]|nr:UDP-N-acetyl glucosamine 2-epimerase [Synergistales bacterium]